MPSEVWTIGHSTRTIDEFIQMLASYGIRALADVRRFPASRRHPQFNQRELGLSLAANGIEYAHFPELGGRRRPRPDSPPTVWRNEAFRGYADYMRTEPFLAGIERLRQTARAQPTVIMCAEAVWWRCHRALIADYLKSQGIKVTHIMSPTKSELHPYTSAARIVDGKLSYGSG